MKRVLLVGSTDGIGRALAEEYLARSWRVCIMGRSPQKLQHVVDELRAGRDRSAVSGVVCDVTVPDRVGPAFEQALRELGQLDLLFYCAGVMEGGRSAEERGRRAREMFEVNAAAAVHFLELGAEYMLEAGRGRLGAIGSVAGDRVRKGNPAYGASKAGLHGYLDGLRHRLHGTGLTVSTVKPGWVKTGMLTENKSLAVAPEVAARKIAHGLERRREVFYVPSWWQLVGLALSWTPRFLFKRVGPP